MNDGCLGEKEKKYSVSVSCYARAEHENLNFNSNVTVLALRCKVGIFNALSIRTGSLWLCAAKNTCHAAREQYPNRKELLIKSFWNMKPLTATDKWTTLNIFRQGARRLSLLQCGLSQVMSTCIIIAEHCSVDSCFLLCFTGWVTLK